MSAAQVVLRKVIALGFYGSGLRTVVGGYHYCSEYMCHAVQAAHGNGQISEAELQTALDSINEYLGGAHIMTHALQEAGLISVGLSCSDWSMTLGRNFYYNWDARPALGGNDD